MDREETDDLRKRIICYWDAAGLCSFDSSTSIKDSNIANLESCIERRLMEIVIADHFRQNTKSNEISACLDIGAGLGRFTLVVSKYFNYVHAIEPATSLYQKLEKNCSAKKNIFVFYTDLENFNREDNYDFVILSGILYLYPNDLIKSTLQNIHRKMKNGGILLIRDFIINNGERQVPSKYVDGEYCYYRNPSYWEEIEKFANFIQTDVFSCGPCYSSTWMRALIKLRLTRCFNTN